MVDRSASRSDAAISAAILSQDLYQLLLDVQNHISAPGHASMANGALLKIDAARRALRVAPSETAPHDFPRMTPAEAEALIRWHDATSQFAAQTDDFKGERHHQMRRDELNRIVERRNGTARR